MSSIRRIPLVCALLILANSQTAVMALSLSTIGLMKLKRLVKGSVERYRRIRGLKKGNKRRKRTRGERKEYSKKETRAIATKAIATTTMAHKWNPFGENMIL